MRWRAVKIQLVPLLLLLAAAWAGWGFTFAPAWAFVRTSIVVDGNLGDWEVVLNDPDNNIMDQSKEAGDPDAPTIISTDRDLRRFAHTWDQQNLYLYLLRVTSGNNNIYTLFYLDLGHDGIMQNTDRLLACRFNNTGYQGGALYAYDPYAAGGDSMGGDGQRMPGRVGAQVTPISLSGAAGTSGIEFEIAISWSSLGVSPGAPLYIHVSSSRGLPNQYNDSQIEDNMARADTLHPDLALAPNREGSVGFGGSIYYLHVVTNTGTFADVAFLSTSGTRPQWSATIIDDTNQDGVHQVGETTVIAQTPSVPAGGRHTFFVRITAPNGGPNGEEDVTTVQATSANDPGLRPTVTDATVKGDLTLLPDGAKNAVAGTAVLYSHLLANHTAGPLNAALSASSAEGWTYSFYADPNCDGVPDGGPITSVPLGPQSQACIVVATTVPVGAPLGTQERAQITATAGSYTASARDSTLVTPRLQVEPDHTVANGGRKYTNPGESVFYPHQVTNNWYQSDSVVLTSSSPADFQVTFWNDPDGDGSPSDGQVITRTPLLVPNGGVYHIVVQVAVSPAVQDGTTGRSLITGTSTLAPAVRDPAVDDVTVHLAATYGDPSFTEQRDGFALCETIHARAGGLDPNTAGKYRFRWLDNLGQERRVQLFSTDAEGHGDDNFYAGGGENLGGWRVEVQRKQGSNWLPLTQHNYDLDSAGSIPVLFSDSSLYALGSTAEFTATLRDDMPVAPCLATTLEQTVFVDGNGNGQPDAGEIYVTSDGLAAVYDPGDTTRLLTNLDVYPLSTYTDNWTLTFDPSLAEGTYTLYSRWSTPCGPVIATRTTNFDLENEPTAVELTSLEAIPSAAGIMVRWETASEWNTLGFNLYRQAGREGALEQINAALILSQVPGTGMGAQYAFFDPNVEPGVTYRYILEDVDVSGKCTSHGPVEATAPYAIFLPFLQR